MSFYETRVGNGGISMSKRDYIDPDDVDLEYDDEEEQEEERWSDWDDEERPEPDEFDDRLPE